VLGWTSLTRWSERAGYDDTAETALYVHSAHRGCGIGRRLMAAAAKRARARGCRRVELTVSPRNAAARRFYQGLGFVAIEEAPLRLSGAALDDLGSHAEARP